MSRILYKVSLNIFLYFFSFSIFGQNIPEHAQGLSEEIITVEFSAGYKQAGVLSLRKGQSRPTSLAVLLPGYPSVVRAVVEGGVMTSSRLSGNFLIRSRKYLVNDSIATLVVDCRSDIWIYCSSDYQASKSRQDDVEKLINEVKTRYPSISNIWLVGTSMGTVSSAFMPMYNTNYYSGVIHTATISEPLEKQSYKELNNFNYGDLKVKQYFIHHVNDGCYLTPYKSLKDLAMKFNIPVITVSGGNNFKGHPCQAFAEHGFMGMEEKVMSVIADIILTGSIPNIQISAD